MLHGTQLSLIQLGGGIATGVQGKQTNYYSSFNVSLGTSIGVRTNI